MSDPKFIISVIATILTIIGYIPYFEDIFRRKTKPHLYTWLIWLITLGTATFALWEGGGGYALFSMVTGTFLVFGVFILSFKFGTKNITRSDTLILFVALLAIFVWWKLNNPLLAVIMVSIIDYLGYVPTFRKSFVEPWSETLSFWMMMLVANILTIISSDAYNLLTMTYIATLILGNITILTICFYRRKVIARPN